MIDLERLEACLDLALADELRVQRAAVAPHVPPPAPDPVPPPVAPRCRRTTSGDAASRPRPSPSPPSRLAPPAVMWDELDIEQHARTLVDLVGQAKLAEADLHIAAHADLTRGSHRHRGDAVGWAAMRALLDGRQGPARGGVEELRALDPTEGDSVSRDRYWTQRFALALTWGGVDERYDVVDHCRERAYCHGDLAWQGRLVLLLARLGRAAEARRDFDATIGAVLSASTTDRAWLDLATDLAEATGVLGDPERGDLARQALTRASMPPVVVAGPAWVCKGSVARYQALTMAASGAIDESDTLFRSAAETHRHLGAQVLLTRTLGEWGRSLAGRESLRSAQLVGRSTEMAQRLGLAGDHVLDEVGVKAS